MPGGDVANPGARKCHVDEPPNRGGCAAPLNGSSMPARAPSAPRGNHPVPWSARAVTDHGAAFRLIALAEEFAECRERLDVIAEDLEGGEQRHGEEGARH